MQKNIKIILSKAPSFGDSVHKYALWWRKCRPFYAVWMSSRRYSHANYYRQFMAEQLSDNVRNGGGLFPHSSILLIKPLLTTSVSLLFHLQLGISGQTVCSLEIVGGDGAEGPGQLQVEPAQTHPGLEPHFSPAQGAEPFPSCSGSAGLPKEPRVCCCLARDRCVSCACPALSPGDSRVIHLALWWSHCKQQLLPGRAWNSPRVLAWDGHKECLMKSEHSIVVTQLIAMTFPVGISTPLMR